MGRNNYDFNTGKQPVTFSMRAKDGSWSGSHTFMASSGDHARALADNVKGYERVDDDQGKMGS